MIIENMRNNIKTKLFFSFSERKKFEFANNSKFKGRVWMESLGNFAN